MALNAPCPYNLEGSMIPTISEIQEALDRKRTDHYVYLHTGEIIAEATGVFSSDLETPVMYSDNAAVGRMLQTNAQALRIQHDEANVPVSDSNGHRTHASIWRLEPRDSQ